MKVCNVVSNETYNYPFFVNKKVYGAEFDFNLPTLIIGWEYVKKNYDNVSILEKQIGNNLCWTFSKIENRYEYLKDIKNFYNSVFEYYAKKIKYIYFNVYTSKYSSIKKIINYILSGRKTVFIYEDRMLYLYGGENFVIGISISDLIYFNIKKEKIYNIISKNNKVIYDKDIKKDLYEKIGENKFLIPFIFHNL